MERKITTYFAPAPNAVLHVQSRLKTTNKENEVNFYINALKRRLEEATANSNDSKEVELECFVLDFDSDVVKKDSTVIFHSVVVVAVVIAFIQSYKPFSGKLGINSM